MVERMFKGNCQICARKDVWCNTHHFVPKRLLNIIPLKKKKKWKDHKVKVCKTYHRHIHPENKLYIKIKGLLKEINRLNKLLEETK